MNGDWQLSDSAKQRASGAARCRFGRRRGSIASVGLAFGCMLSVGAIAAYPTQGEAAPVSAAAVEPAATASVLRLTGTVMSPTQNVFRAIIDTSEAGTRSYGIGDMLPDGSTLVAVRADGVVLSRDKRERFVTLELAEGASRHRSVEPTRTAPRPPAAADAATPRDAAAAMRANPVLLVQLLPVEAIMNREHLVALRVGKPDDASLLGELKLLPGDVITAINGVELAGPDSDAWMRSGTAPANELALTVYRDGHSRTLRY